MVKKGSKTSYGLLKVRLGEEFGDTDNDTDEDEDSKDRVWSDLNEKSSKVSISIPNSVWPSVYINGLQNAAAAKLYNGK